MIHSAACTPAPRRASPLGGRNRTRRTSACSVFSQNRRAFFFFFFFFFVKPPPAFQVAPAQPPPQCIPSSRKPAADRTDWPAQRGGCLVMSQAFQVAQHDRCAVLLRQPADFLVQALRGFCPLDRAGIDLARSVCFENLGRGRGIRATVAHAMPNRIGFRAVRDAHSHTVEPASQRLAFPDRTCPPRKHKEDRLPRVVNVARIIEDLATHPLDHRPMALDKQLECQLAGLIARGQEPREQLSVRERGAGPRAPEQLQGLTICSRRCTPHRHLPRPQLVRSHS